MKMSREDVIEAAFLMSTLKEDILEFLETNNIEVTSDPLYSREGLYEGEEYFFMRGGIKLGVKSLMLAE